MLYNKNYISCKCVLRLDKRTSSKERNVLAASIFTQLGLLERSDTFISKLSGGEMKRLSLAVELVTKPKILFLDEPTSGEYGSTMTMRLTDIELYICNVSNY